MKVPTISKTSSRPQIRRMSQRELQDPTRSSNDFDYPSMASTNRWPNRIQSQVVPIATNPWRASIEPPRNNNNPPNDKPFFRQGWFWLFGGIFCLLLVIAIVAIILGIVLPMTITTVSPDATATAKMAMVDVSDPAGCSGAGRGLIAFLNGLSPSGWTSYSFNYSATQTTPTLTFGFETDGSRMYYLDAVSVVDYSAPSIELLTNPSFENSTTNATGWITSCEATCSATASQIVFGSQCFGSSGNCFMAYCTAGNSSISFLSQSFLTTIGNTYKISYILNQAGSPSTGIMSFYLDVN